VKGSILKTTSDILLVSRVREWGVHVLVLGVVSLCCFSVSDVALVNYVFSLSVVSLHYGSMQAFCYMLNDWTDRQTDLRQGKKKWSRGFSGGEITAILTGLLAIAAGAILYLTRSPAILTLVVLGLIVSIAYSVKPWRLKERGKWAILAAAIVQRVPAFVILAILVSMDVKICVYVSVWLSLLGFIFILEHQVEDCRSDHQQGVKTLVAERGIEVGLRLRRAAYIAFLLWAIVPGLLLLVRVAGPSIKASFVVPMTSFSLLGAVLLRIRYSGNSQALHHTMGDWPEGERHFEL